ncbi:MAG: twin-arginine translocation signal domain-containing protein, partial [Actinopolymorphaceae bacterium]
MTGLTRRGFLGAASALAAAGIAAGCNNPDSTSGPGGKKASGGLEWWDHFSSYQKLHDDWAAKQSSALGTSVAHTYYDASKAQQAFQLAQQANKMPDVYSNIIGLPLAALVSGNWVHELSLSEETLAKIPDNILTEGITTL